MEEVKKMSANSKHEDGMTKKIWHISWVIKKKNISSKSEEQNEKKSLGEIGDIWVVGTEVQTGKQKIFLVNPKIFAGAEGS